MYCSSKVLIGRSQGIESKEHVLAGDFTFENFPNKKLAVGNESKDDQGQEIQPMDCGPTNHLANSRLGYTTNSCSAQWGCGLGFVGQQGPCQADGTESQSRLCTSRSGPHPTLAKISGS